jgi:hypothetical protein
VLPWGHAAVGYLSYTAVRYARERRVPTEWALIAALAVGTQFPDLMDKPLAWELGVLPTGRSLGHTLLLFVPVVAALWAALPERRRPVAAFAVGWVSHLFADSYTALLGGDLAGAGYLLWPLTDLPASDPSEYGLLTFFLELRFTPAMGFELALTGLAGAVWLAGRRWNRTTE